MKTSTLKNIIIVIVLLASFGIFLYVRSVINENEVKIKKKDDSLEKRVVDEKPVDVTLIIDNGITKNKYDLELKNTDTILDVLSNLRQQDLLIYEKTHYIYGTEIDHMNYANADENNRWKVYMTLSEKGVADLIKNVDPPMEEQLLLRQAVDNKFDVTYEFEDINLVESGIYEFELTRIEELQ